MVASKDDAYHRYLTKHGLFAPLMRSFQQSVTPPALGGNLLVSATLDLLELIRLENFKALVDHICTKHGPMLQEHVSKFKTLDMFFLRHQQNLEYEAFPPDQYSSGGPLQRVGRQQQTRPARTRSPGREDSDEDEAYFESEDDEQVTENPQAGGTEVQPTASQQQKPTGQPIEGSTHTLPTADAAVIDAPLGNQESGKPALKELLLGYDDDDEEDPPLPTAEDSPLQAAVDDRDHTNQTQGTNLEVDTEEAKTELRAIAAAAAAEAAAAVARGNIVNGDVVTTEEVKQVHPEESTTVMTPVVEESSKTIEEEATHTSIEVGCEAVEDPARAPSAKAKAETRSLNHVVKRMKVN